MRSYRRAAAILLTGAALMVGLIVGLERWSRAGASAPLTSAPDCETIRTGLIGQPVTAWTSLAFVAAGIWVAGRTNPPAARTRAVFAISLVAVGLGSFLAHAAQTDWGRQLDSIAIKAMLVAFIAYPASLERNRQPRAFVRGWLLGSAGVIGVQLAWPATARPLLVALALAALLLAARRTTRPTRRAFIAGTGLLGLGAAAWWLGRSVGPLCSPDAVFQLHGIWHILAAAGIASVYEIYRSEPA